MNLTEHKTHWIHKLFVDHPELYLQFLENAKERSEAETEALAGIFERIEVPEHGRVLDVACEIGRHSILLAQRGYRVTGIDISPLFVRGQSSMQARWG